MCAERQADVVQSHASVPVQTRVRQDPNGRVIITRNGPGPVGGPVTSTQYGPKNDVKVRFSVR